MTTCPACGATVTLAQDVNTGERVPLEAYTDSGTDAPRYRALGSEQPIKVERVPANSPGDFYPDHRFDCPDFPANAS